MDTIYMIDIDDKPVVSAHKNVQLIIFNFWYYTKIYLN